MSVQGGDEVAGSRAAEEALLEIAAAAAEEIAHVEREASMTFPSRPRWAHSTKLEFGMISATDPAEVLRMATSSAAMSLGADHAILRVQDDETRRYVIRSYFGSADGPAPGADCSDWTSEFPSK